VNPGAKAPQSILPLPHERGEPIVVKHRISPFIGTGLETLLRANGIDTLVLAGVHTSGVVLSTVRPGGDLDTAWSSSEIAAPAQIQRCMLCRQRNRLQST
jgi:nicotinamidase-related amidase